MTGDERQAVAACIAADMRQAAADELRRARWQAVTVIVVSAAAVIVAWVLR